MISDKIGKDFPDMDIADHEINKFIFIFHILLKTSLNSNKLSEIITIDTKDGVQGTILSIVTKLLNLLKGTIESLKLPKVIKNGLRKLKSILFLTNKINGWYKNGSEDSKRSEKATATTRIIDSKSTSLT